ncbi:MAG: site-specific DNA-methyltransferase [Synergistaceae bacterium]|nr:site-specific DNA-methyltransferase [Synergistaceae bacterium]
MLQKTIHTVICGDCRDMRILPDKSIDLIITSPPYWQLKDYGGDNQIGFNDSYEVYINHLNLAWRECFRVLHEGCRLCVNIGDQFARSVYYGRYKVIPIHSEVIQFCETLGFDFMGQIIWRKSTTTHTSGGGSVMGSYPFPRNGIVKLDFEYILLFKKSGNAKIPALDQKNAAKMTPEEWNTYFAGHWTFPGAKQDKHLAMFPEELPRRLVKMFSFPGETVLDPFAGSGTTAKTAKALGRNSVSYEINAAYIPLIEKRLGSTDTQSELRVVFDTELPSREQLSSLISELPYQFYDVHKFDKKIDVKKLQYGSKIDAEGAVKQVVLYSVRKIISTELVQLSDDTIVRLIGIKLDAEKSESAKSFLAEKFKGRRVFMKHDTVKYDDENHLLAYLYLENKAFINAHLLKKKYAHVDDVIPFRMSEKFHELRYGGEKSSMECEVKSKSKSKSKSKK